LTFEPIVRHPRLEELQDGEVVGTGQPVTEAVFELVLAVGIPTQIPRVGFTFETIFIPSGGTDSNPFTGTTANELGRTSLRGNEIEVGPTSMSSTRSAPPSGPATRAPTHTS
jgi:hypothetical protein